MAVLAQVDNAAGGKVNWLQTWTLVRGLDDPVVRMTSDLRPPAGYGSAVRFHTDIRSADKFWTDHQLLRLVERQYDRLST